MWTLEKAKEDYKKYNKETCKKDRRICENCIFSYARDSRNIDYVCEVLNMSTYSYTYGCKYFEKREIKKSLQVEVAYIDEDDYEDVSPCALNMDVF